MTFVLRIGGIAGALCLLIMALGGHILRHEPSTAFWVLGNVQQDDSQSLYLSTPNSGVRREITHRSSNDLYYPVGWVGSTDTFFYLRQTDMEAMQLIRFDIPSFAATHVADHLSATPNRAAFLSQIPHSEWRTIVLDSEAGAAIYRVSADGSMLEAISPTYESISSIYWTDDGEWMYYVAGEGGNLTNGLFRQRLDGSGHEALMQFRGTAYLTPTVNGSNIFLFTVFHNTITSRRQVFRIGPRDDEPIALTPANENFSLAFQTPHDWVILSEDGSDSRDNHLYRIGIGGDNLAPLYPLDSDIELLDIVHPIGVEDIVIVAKEGDFAMIYRINMVTLERNALTPPEHFTNITGARLVDDGATVLFEGTVNIDSGYYRVDVQGLPVHKIADLAFSQSQTNLVLYSENIGLIIEPIANGTHTQIVRIDLRTGDRIALVQFDTHLVNVGLRFAPQHIGGIIVTSYGTPSRQANFQQRWIDPETNSVESVVYGSDWRFSPIVDTDWSVAPTLGLGVGLLLASVGWSAHVVGKLN
jgi:hypothetical protein